jgi:hypothetical protein
MVKHINSSLAICGILAICAVSCTSETIQKVDPDIQFQFRLLKEDGTCSNSFSRGENFRFCFLILNNTNQTWSLERVDDVNNFLRVYQVDAEPQEGGNIIDVGRPWETMFCQYRLALLMLPHDTLKLEIPWMPEPPAWNPDHPHFNSVFCRVTSNSPLPPGKYKTAFTSAFELFSGDISYRTEKKTFEVVFEVR